VGRNNRRKPFQKKSAKENSDSAFGSIVEIEGSEEEIARGSTHTADINTEINRGKHIEFWLRSQMERG
jgi:hypothetical protein